MNRADYSQLNSGAREGKPAVAAASPRLIIRTCRHIKDSGAFCRQAAVGGRKYCRAHLLLRERLRRMARAHRRAGVLKLPRLTDLRAVEAGTAQVRVALAADHIDAGLARLLLWAMRQIASDMRFIERQEALSQGGPTATNRRLAAGDKFNQHYHIAISYSGSNFYKQNSS